MSHGRLAWLFAIGAGVRARRRLHGLPIASRPHAQCCQAVGVLRVLAVLLAVLRVPALLPVLAVLGVPAFLAVLLVQPILWVLAVLRLVPVL